MVQGDQQQAGKMAWSAIGHYLQAIAGQRGWRIDNPEMVADAGHQIAVEFMDGELSEAILDVFHNGHRLIYRNQRDRAEMRETIAYAEDALKSLEIVLHAKPRPFTIKSNRQLCRLRTLTGNDNLQIGDSSPVGFSLKHAADGDNPDGGNNDAAATE